MIIVNTTFVLHHSIENEMKEWIKTKYLSSASKLSAPGYNPLFTKVLNGQDPDSSAYAIHIYFADMDSARRWNEGVAQSMRGIISERWGERALMFHTYLEVTE